MKMLRAMRLPGFGFGDLKMVMKALKMNHDEGRQCLDVGQALNCDESRKLDER